MWVPFHGLLSEIRAESRGLEEQDFVAVLVRGGYSLRESYVAWLRQPFLSEIMKTFREISHRPITLKARPGPLFQPLTDQVVNNSPQIRNCRDHRHAQADSCPIRPSKTKLNLHMYASITF